MSPVDRSMTFHVDVEILAFALESTGGRGVLAFPVRADGEFFRKRGVGRPTRVSLAVG